MKTAMFLYFSLINLVFTPEIQLMPLKVTTLTKWYYVKVQVYSIINPAENILNVSQGKPGRNFFCWPWHLKSRVYWSDLCQHTKKSHSRVNHKAFLTYFMRWQNPINSSIKTEWKIKAPQKPSGSQKACAPPCQPHKMHRNVQNTSTPLLPADLCPKTIFPTLSSEHCLSPTKREEEVGQRIARALWNRSLLSRGSLFPQLRWPTGQKEARPGVSALFL